VLPIIDVEEETPLNRAAHGSSSWGWVLGAEPIQKKAPATGARAKSGSFKGSAAGFARVPGWPLI